MMHFMKTKPQPCNKTCSKFEVRLMKYFLTYECISCDQVAFFYCIRASKNLRIEHLLVIERNLQKQKNKTTAKESESSEY